MALVRVAGCALALSLAASLGACRTTLGTIAEEDGGADAGSTDGGAGAADASAADGGTRPEPGDGGAAPARTACGAAQIGAERPRMLDRYFQGYHGVGTDGVDVYYPAELDGVLYRVPLAGGRPTTLLSQPYLRNVKSRGTRVCWMSEGVIACKDGGGPVVLVHMVTEPRWHDSWDYHRDFDIDDTDAYWIDATSVWRAPLAGGGPATLVASGEERTKSIAVGADRVVWSTDVFSVVRSCDKRACTTPVEHVSWGRPPFAIIGRMAADATHAYVPVHLSEDGRRGGKLVRVPLAGGPLETLLDCLDESPVNAALDGPDVYLLAHGGRDDWSLQGSTAAGSVYALPRAGGALRRLATGQPYPSHIAFAPTSVVWINEWDRQGQVMALDR